MNNEILLKKNKVLKEMEKALRLMDYIKAMDTALKCSTDVKFKNFWHARFVSAIYQLKDECIPLRKVLEEWFQIEKDNNLEKSLTLHASYKAMEGF